MSQLCGLRLHCWAFQSRCHHSHHSSAGFGDDAKSWPGGIGMVSSMLSGCVSCARLTNCMQDVSIALPDMQAAVSELLLMLQSSDRASCLAGWLHHAPGNTHSPNFASSSSASNACAGSVTANLQDIRHKVESSQATFASVVGVLDAATKRLRELRREQDVSELEPLGPFVSRRLMVYTSNDR